MILFVVVDQDLKVELFFSQIIAGALIGPVRLTL